MYTANSSLYKSHNEVSADYIVTTLKTIQNTTFYRLH